MPSNFLFFITDIIENMKKNGMHVEAVDIVYNFGIEDKFSPYTILTSLLRESREAWKRKRRDAPHPLVLAYSIATVNIQIFFFILINGVVS